MSGCPRFYPAVILQSEIKLYKMKRLLKKMFTAVYILSPIVILSFVSMMALAGNDLSKTTTPRLHSPKQTRQTAAKEHAGYELNPPVFTMTLLKVLNN
jgi:hypothetical protein